jgi:hypothetical protein
MPSLSYTYYLLQPWEWYNQRPLIDMLRFLEIDNNIKSNLRVATRHLFYLDKVREHEASQCSTGQVKGKENGKKRKGYKWESRNDTTYPVRK